VEASRILDGFTATVADYDRSDTLGDGDIFTQVWISAENVLTVCSKEPFSSLYLVWENEPGEYAICWDGGSIACGQDYFLHEYVTFPEPVTRVEFVFPDEESRLICDLFGYTKGYAPADVQIWQPPCEEADILVFPTHADDDTLFFGPLIAYYAIERQLTVQTAFMVHHRGYPERSHERLNGLWAMGVRHYPILGQAPDTATYDFQEAMAYYARSNIQDWQVEQIRRFKPLVVVGHDLNGGYGNAGHKVNAHFLTTAITAAADPQQHPASAELYGTWQAPKLYLHLYRQNEWYLDVNTPMVNDPLGRTPFQAAEDGFDAHKSQHKWWFYVQQDDNNRSCDCRPFGLYYTLVGYDTVADVMDNIDVSQWRTAPDLEEQ